MSDEALAPPRHEPGDVGLRFIATGVAGLAMLLLLVLGIAAWLFPATVGARFVPEHLPQPASPALQPPPRLDMQAFRAAQLQDLNGVGWTDKASGHVHIPIETAMGKLLAEGIADWPGPRK